MRTVSAPPSTVLRLTLLPAVLVAAAPVHADDAALLRCRQLADAAPRLACYDAIRVETPEQAQRRAEQRFGIDKPRDDEALAIESTVTGGFDGWRPGDRIRLANGQVWQIADDSSGALPVGLTKVKVRRGAFGAYYLEIEGSNRSPRVRRVQ